jgi:ribosomal protein L11 methyltransferase
MNYNEIKISWESPVDATVVGDVLASELGNIGFESFVEDADGLMAYIPVSAFDSTELENSFERFPIENVTFSYVTSVIKERDWNEVWEQNYFQPVRIDNECIIRAPFHPEESGFNYEILIQPKMAFGTGNHETTVMMIRSILAIDLEGKETLDMGCGTGILAILAAKKGAGRVVAIDIDEWAYNNTIEDCRLNQIADIKVVLGGAEQIAPLGKFDYIFSNINRNVLLQDIPAYFQALKPGGQLIMSGFYKEDLPLIESKCTQSGLRPITTTQHNNWVTIITMREN